MARHAGPARFTGKKEDRLSRDSGSTPVSTPGPRDRRAGIRHPRAGSCSSVAVMSPRPFEIVCEIEPPVRPDLTHARHQIGVLTAVSVLLRIPDNHLGRATVSSIAVAHEVQAMGGHSIACINSRDRNLPGFRRDLLTAAAYGISQFLFVYGDKPGTGGRTSDLTVRCMIEEARTCTASDPAFAGVPAWRIGVAAAEAPAPLEARRRLHLQPGQLLGRRPAALARRQPHRRSRLRRRDGPGQRRHGPPHRPRRRGGDPRLVHPPSRRCARRPWALRDRLGHRDPRDRPW